MNSLPASVNYAEPIPSLPDGATRYSNVLQPVNGSSFSMGSGVQIIWQLPSRGYLIPDSFYIRYKMVVTNATTASAIIGTPLYAPFARCETSFGSVVVDSINNYNMVSNIITNCTYSVADKYGVQSAFGYGSQTAVPTMEDLDGALVPIAGLTGFYGGPLPCMISNSDKLLPLFCMPTIQFTLTLDALNNIIVPTGTVTAITLSNVELCFDWIDLGAGVDAMVRGMGEKIYIKSQSFSSSSVSIASGQNGSSAIIFNNRYASIKSAIVTFSGSAASSNKYADAVDITNGTGDYSLNISGVQYPQRPLSSLLNRAGILIELKRCIGSLYDSKNAMSINYLEFNMNDNSAFVAFNQPAKFYLGFLLEKLHTNALLTGISSNSSNITLNISQSTASTVARQANLMLGYDALIEIDTRTLQSSVKV
jgi:hypothetical protein